jgi:hypothetical protein
MGGRGGGGAPAEPGTTISTQTIGGKKYVVTTTVTPKGKVLTTKIPKRKPAAPGTPGPG